MSQPKFDYQGALDAEYTLDEINNFLKQKSDQPNYKPTQTGSAWDRIVNNASNFLGNLGNFGNFEKPSEQQKPNLANSIDQNLLKHTPNFDVQKALEAGYEPDEINEFLQKQVPEKSLLEKGGRLAAQYGLGALQGTPAGMVYDIATAPLSSEGAQTVSYRQNVMEDIEQMAEQKLNASKGIGDWSKNDEELFQHLQDQIKHPERAEQFVKTLPDISIHGLAQKAVEPFGIDLEPEGVLEKAANWAGFIKNPKNIKNLATIGLTPKAVTKALLPAPTEAIRGLSAGAALQMAQEGNFGPIGTIASAVTGDLLGFGPKGLTYIAKNPKRILAQATNRLTGANSKKEWIKDLISDADKAGVQLDAGTLTDSNIVRWAQARAAQSALSGDALDNFRKNLSGQIVSQYEKIANQLGTLSFENNHQAAESIRNFVNQEERSLFEKYGQKTSQEARPLVGRIAVEEQPNYQQRLLNQISPQEFRNNYEAGETLKTIAEDIKNPIKEEFSRRWENLNREIEILPAEPHAELSRVIRNFIEEQQGSLLLGESTAENRVLQSAIRLRDAISTEEGALIGVTLRDLIKTKRTLGDIANWEFGGSNFQSAYKHLVSEIDRTIERSLGNVNPALRNAYEQLNAEYSQFKNIFENKNVLPLFEPRNENFNTIYNSFLKNPDNLRSLEDILIESPRGQQVINQVKRDYAQRIIERPNLQAREMRNLQNVLGPQFEAPFHEFLLGQQHAMEHPLPRAARRPSLGTNIEIPAITPGRSLKGRGKPSALHARRKLYEYVKNKDSDKIMKQMDTVEGIKKLKRTLSLTPDGIELFNKLARYKLFELIDRQMMDNLGENLKIGKFSGLLKGKKTEGVVKELIGDEAFSQLKLLQKNSGRLQASLDKFYNFSKSGSTLADVASISTFISAIITGNPYLASISGANILGTYVGARLLSDPKFLGYLKESILTNNNEKFIEILKKMKPEVDRAIIKTSMEDREEK